MSDSQVNICIDDQLRLITAVLAASDWPDYEQAQLTHAVHPHAKQTRQYLAAYNTHPAVIWVNQVIEQGEPLDEVFTAVSQNVQQEAFADFQTTTNLTAFWQEHTAEWDKAKNDLTDIFNQSQLPAFLNQISDAPITQTIRIMPNLTYPSLSPVLVSDFDTLTLMPPLPKAVGESPPWPYGEDPGWVHAEVCRRLVQFALADTLTFLPENEHALLLHAAVTLYLETAVDEGEAMAYMVRSKKQHSVPTLPLVVENLRAYLANPGEQLMTTVINDLTRP
ncbi:MAG: hypothetical protein CSB13_12105 [Chloroflexi bacterium]|nr:MAG: hypothetical protein CSB13_12105 [Chloroflexota bacterium]